jgi:hypothetical protein
VAIDETRILPLRYTYFFSPLYRSSEKKTNNYSGEGFLFTRYKIRSHTSEVFRTKTKKQNLLTNKAKSKILCAVFVQNKEFRTK